VKINFHFFIIVIIIFHHRARCVHHLFVFEFYAPLCSVFFPHSLNLCAKSISILTLVLAAPLIFSVLCHCCCCFFFRSDFHTTPSPPPNSVESEAKNVLKTFPFFSSSLPPLSPFHPIFGCRFRLHADRNPATIVMHAHFSLFSYNSFPALSPTARLLLCLVSLLDTTTPLMPLMFFCETFILFNSHQNIA
jgi:hypothetical protein